MAPPPPKGFSSKALSYKLSLLSSFSISLSQAFSILCFSQALSQSRSQIITSLCSTRLEAPPWVPLPSSKLIHHRAAEVFLEAPLVVPTWSPYFHSNNHTVASSCASEAGSTVLVVLVSAAIC